MLRQRRAGALRAIRRRLGQAESHSHVTRAQVNKLLQDETFLDQAIQSVGLDSSTTSGDIVHVQDEVDGAFIETNYQADGWANKREQLDQYLSGVPANATCPPHDRADASGCPGGQARTALLRHHRDHGRSGDLEGLGPTDTNLGPARPIAIRSKFTIMLKSANS